MTTPRALFKFIASNEPQLEDDAYVCQANRDIQIQCCQDGTFRVTQSITEANEFSQIDHGTYANRNEAANKAISVLTLIGEKA